MLRSPLLTLALSLTLYITTTSNIPAQQTTVHPKPSPAPLDNPLKGWCPYTDAGPIHQPYSMVFQYISWAELEPMENEYRFEQWERSWDEGLGKDKHIIFRVYIDYPSKPSGLPDWLRKKGVKESSYTDYGGGISPDYNDPKMVAAMERLIAALGQRYNNNPRIAFIQLGLLGFWGEWHTYPRNKLYASAETEQRIIDAYRIAFPNKSLMVRYARDYVGKQNWIGFHDDMFPEDTDNGKDWSFLAGLRREQQTDNWERSVVGGEMVPLKAQQFLGQDFELTTTMLSRAHFSWIGPYCPALEDSKDVTFQRRSEQLVRRMGYNFQITEVSHAMKADQSLAVKLKGTNTGVAPFYYPWSVEWALLDESGKLVSKQETNWDIRKWLPGAFQETAELTFSVPAGRYQLGLGIRDPWKDRPAIGFANDLQVVDGWTIISEVEVSK